MKDFVSNAPSTWQNVTLSEHMRVPTEMKAWVLDDPEQLSLTTKLVPAPGKAEALVRIDAVAIFAKDLEIIKYGPPR